VGPPSSTLAGCCERAANACEATQPSLDAIPQLCCVPFRPRLVKSAPLREPDLAGSSTQLEDRSSSCPGQNRILGLRREHAAPQLRRYARVDGQFRVPHLGEVPRTSAGGVHRVSVRLDLSGPLVDRAPRPRATRPSGAPRPSSIQPAPHCALSVTQPHGHPLDPSYWSGKNVRHREGVCQFKNNHSTEMCSGSEAGSYLRRIDSWITHLQARGPSRTCNESKEEEEGSAGPECQCPRWLERTQHPVRSTRNASAVRFPTFTQQGTSCGRTLPGDEGAGLQGYLAHKKHPPPRTLH